MKKPVVEVVCAIIESEGKVLAVRRKKGEKMEGLWEFPGGKIQRDENLLSSITREIMEELGIIIEPVHQISPIKHEYPDFIIHLFPFRCIIKEGTIQLKVHDRMKWILPADFLKLSWCDADKLIAIEIKKNFILR
jgi:8-oxo-dGTP diphosphatase